ncbi:protein YLS7 [Syzygium oleosum]|uniref:protein YLS7 n=1 Tax=Syzygium oleosum TaxID=219896 RepID=UPI0011D2B95E|nr:protein YLS7 [Syzygium oleosum]
MTLSSPKGSSAISSFPRSLSVIAVAVGGLAMFLMVASLLLVSHPIGSTVRGYFYGVDSLSEVDLAVSPYNDSGVAHSVDKSVDGVSEVPSSKPFSEVYTGSNDSSASVENKELEYPVNPVPPVSSGLPLGEEGNSSSKNDKLIENTEITKPVSSDAPDGSAYSASGTTPLSTLLGKRAAANTSVEIGCDLYRGSWFYDSLGPLYTNNTCPVLTQMQNCQGNGRPDKEYENWRWKPSQCDLPRFDAKKFLELMRGKTLAFIGDSVARNQMESMLCILWQVEVPKNRGNRRMQRWYFKSTSVMIVRMWSSWLVHQSNEAIDFAPEGVVKLNLDAPDKDIMEFLPKFDVVVLSSGHWFAKQSVYVLDNKIVGGQLWWPDKSRKMKVNNVEAFGISVETILSAIVTHPNFTGVTILRSYSPDHYEGGAWNTGGSCTGKVRPLAAGELVENGFTNIMLEKQVTGFYRAIKKASNKSKLRLMDITEAFGYRHDGHPGPYRSPDPNKITKRGPDGKPPPQDCLHWCMPGPVDTWNELVLEIIRRELDGD